MDIENQINELSKSNMELSLMLLGNRSDTPRTGIVNYLFGRPLEEIYSILLEHEQKQHKKRFVGEFTIGGTRDHVKDHVIKLYRCNDPKQMNQFIDTIKPSNMAWDGIE